MDIEIQGIPQSVRAQYHTRLRASKADLSRYKKLAADVRGQLARSDLLSIASQPGNYPASDDPYGPSSDRTRLLAGTSILEDGTKRLQQSQRIALETEDQGAEILSNLRQQREQIENSRNTVSHIRGLGSLIISLRYTQLYRADLAIDRASGTLKKMVRRYEGFHIVSLNKVNLSIDFSDTSFILQNVPTACGDCRYYHRTSAAHCCHHVGEAELGALFYKKRKFPFPFGYFSEINSKIKLREREV